MKNRYQALTDAVVGKTFYLPAKTIPDDSKDMDTKGQKDDRKSNADSGSLENSKCPLKHIHIYDEMVFPQNRTEIKCRSKTCLDAAHQCVTLFSKITVLKRTHECNRGTYVYKPQTIHVATSCVCGLKGKVNNGKAKKHISRHNVRLSVINPM